MSLKELIKKSLADLIVAAGLASVVIGVCWLIAKIKDLTKWLKKRKEGKWFTPDLHMNESA